MTTKTHLLRLLEPVVNDLGYDLVEIEHRAGGSKGLLRLYIDCSAGVTLEDCERVSHQVSGVLDVSDPIPGSYSLEVSSPGARRPLRTRAHFERFVGERVKLELKQAHDGRRRFTGTLVQLDGDDVLVDVDGEDWRLPLSDLQKAHLAPLQQVQNGPHQ